MTAPDAENRLLVVDDEPAIGDMVVRAAKRSGYEAVATDDIGEVLKHTGSGWPTHIMLDLQMPEIDGVEVLRLLAESGSSARIILCSGVDSSLLEHTRRLGLGRGLSVVAALAKPVRLSRLTELLSELKIEPTVTRETLRAAIAAGEIRPYFQPLVDARSRRLHSVEALARWVRADGSIVPPGEFIGLAESEGLMNALTECMVCKVVRQLKEWQQSGLSVTASVNLSPSRLTDLDFVDWFTAECRQTGVNPDRITFELTESAAMGQLVDALDILARLRLKGVRLAIDDFGTGYSSLSQLRRLPFTELKIDRSFVADFETSQDAHAIVQATIMMAHALGLTVVAEGVEKESTADALQRAGCDVLQGFLFAPALVPERFFEWQSRLERGTSERGYV